MEYKGKLYGKIGKYYFPLEQTAEDIDNMKKLIEFYQSEENKPYEPYFGYCDVEGCDNEGCSGGRAWSETGYWTVCSKHSSSYRNGDLQPAMKQSAIDREKRRDKITGYLTN